MLLVAAGDLPASALSALYGMMRKVLPVTTATLAMGGAAYLGLEGVSLDVPQMVRVIFIGIASMTYPHVMVIALAEKSEVIWPQNRMAADPETYPSPISVCPKRHTVKIQKSKEGIRDEMVL
jgi:hypothetical protein